MEPKSIRSEAAPKAVGPYSQAVQVGDLVFASGQIPIDPTTGKIVDGAIREQTRQVLQNLSNVLSATGLDLHAVVKTTVYLLDMSDFAEMNDVYTEFFSAEIKPARACVAVKALPKGARVEIDAIAIT